jgi:hypothetical protein
MNKNHGLFENRPPLLGISTGFLPDFRKKAGFQGDIFRLL